LLPLWPHGAADRAEADPDPQCATGAAAGGLPGAGLPRLYGLDALCLPDWPLPWCLPPPLAQRIAAEYGKNSPGLACPANLHPLLQSGAFCVCRELIFDF